MSDFRVCTHNCRVPHYEDCPDCVGFGRFRRAPGGEVAIVMAGEAMGTDTLPPGAELFPCPTCKSTIKGLPDMTKDQFAQNVADALRDFAVEQAGQDEFLPWLTEILVEELAQRVAAAINVVAEQFAAEVEHEHGLGQVPGGDLYQEYLKAGREAALAGLRTVP